GFVFTRFHANHALAIDSWSRSSARASRASAGTPYAASVGIWCRRTPRTLRCHPCEAFHWKCVHAYPDEMKVRQGCLGPLIAAVVFRGMYSCRQQVCVLFRGVGGWSLYVHRGRPMPAAVTPRRVTADGPLPDQARSR